MSTNSENSRKHLDEINNRKWPRFEKKKKNLLSSMIRLGSKKETKKKIGKTPARKRTEDCTWTLLRLDEESLCTSILLGRVEREVIT